MRLFHERLDALADPLDAGFGFDLIRLAVLAGEPLAPAQIVLDRRAVEVEEVAALIDRLGAHFGTASVLCFIPVDTHIPERAGRAVPAAACADTAGWAGPEPDMPPARPIHLFDPPQPIAAMAEVPDGPPLRFRWRRVLHEVARAEGPERIAPEWWNGDSAGPTRDYYRVEDAAGCRFWIFREGLYGEAAPERFPFGWNHLNDKKSLKSQNLEHILIAKVEPTLAEYALDQDDFRLTQPEIINLIDSNKLVRDAGGTKGLRKRNPVPAFPHPALSPRWFLHGVFA